MKRQTLVIQAVRSLLVQVGDENFILASLHNTRDGQVGRSVVRGEVSLSVTHGSFTLANGSLETDPDEDLSTNIEDEGVVGVQERLADSALSNQREREGARGVAKLEELLLVSSSRLGVSTTLSGGLDRLLSTKKLPELFSTGFALSENLDLNLTSALVIKSASESGSLGLLGDTSLLSNPLDELQAKIEDENVTRIEGVSAERNLSDTQALASTLDVEETRLVLGGLNIVETRGNSTVQQTHTGRVEVGEEAIAFVTRDLTVLNRLGAELVIQLNGLVGL